MISRSSGRICRAPSLMPRTVRHMGRFMRRHPARRVAQAAAKRIRPYLKRLGAGRDAAPINQRVAAARGLARHRSLRS